MGSTVERAVDIHSSNIDKFIPHKLRPQEVVELNQVEIRSPYPFGMLTGFRPFVLQGAVKFRVALLA